MSKGILKVGLSILGGPLVALGVFEPKIASQIGAIAAMIPGPHQPFAAAYAAATGAWAQISAPKPVAKGGVTDVILEAEPPRPYMIGESYSAGVIRHQVGYGEKLKKVPNPYWWEVKVFSGVGPVQSLVQEQFDFKPIGGYYSGFYASDTQLGARPESSALSPPFGAAPNWGSSHKLSGCAAIGSNYKFDKEGEVFASGRPVHGAIWRGEKVYDPRLDDTQPGGSGSCRLGDESTYVYSIWPALHAGTYAYGRFQNGLKIFGIGLSREAIDWAAISDWANDCETNGWGCHGTIYEGGKGVDMQRQRVGNLDDICAAGGGRWIVAGGQLSFDWHRPRVALATITDDDLLESGIGSPAMQSIRDRMNGVRPQYVSPTHNWEQITADEIVGTTYRTEDGRPLTQTWPLNLVKDAGQAGELASYAMADSREIGPIEAHLLHYWRFYKPGECLNLESELLGYYGKVVMSERSIEPQTVNVRMIFKSETDGKHAFALGKVANPPPTPVLGQTAEERDALAAAVSSDPRAARQIITSTVPYPVSTDQTSATIVAFDATLDDGRLISFPAATITDLTPATPYAILWDLTTEIYLAVERPANVELSDSNNVIIRYVATQDVGGTYPPAPTPPGGDQGGGYNPDPTIPQSGSP